MCVHDGAALAVVQAGDRQRDPVQVGKAQRPRRRSRLFGVLAEDRSQVGYCDRERAAATFFAMVYSDSFLWGTWAGTRFIGIRHLERRPA
jgi:hypothetical protein